MNDHNFASHIIQDWRACNINKHKYFEVENNKRLNIQMRVNKSYVSIIMQVKLHWKGN